MSNSMILITGAHGFVGKHLCKELKDYKLITPKSHYCDLRNQITTEMLFEEHRPETVIHLAATVGGIGANKLNPGKFIYDNLAMGINVIEASRKVGVKRFILLGSVCCYGKFTPVPFKESDLWNGYPEETNAPYGIAKRALMQMIMSYREQYNFNGINLIPVNLFGVGDCFDPEKSHVIPAIIFKVYEAIKYDLPYIEIWGSGNASREFLYVEDLVKAIKLALDLNTSKPINIGTGKEVKISDLVLEICALMGYNKEVRFDSSKPDGQPRRCLDITLARNILGFEPKTSLHDGLVKTIEWFNSTRFYG